MAYTKTNWAPGDPITQNRMMNIENGIEAAHNSLDTAIGAANSATSAAGTATARANDAYELAQSAASVASSSQQGAAHGEWAWTQLESAGVIADAQGNVSVGLSNILSTMNNSISTNTTNIGLLNGQISNAINQASGTNYTENAIDTLAKRLAKINYDISTVSSAISNINTNLFNANNQAFDVLGRLRALDGAPSSSTDLPTRTVQSIIEELNNAHESSAFITNGLPTQYSALDGRLEDDETKLANLMNEIEVAHESTALNKTGNNAYANIDERFEAIESELVGTNAISSRIDTLAGDVSDLSTNKINTSAIANNLTTDTAGKVLDARQGKTLNEAKINYTDIVDDVIHTDVDKPLSANQGKVLKDAIDTINSGLNTAETGLVARVSALETEVDMTSASSRIDSALSRLDAIDDSSTGAIKGINDKIDTIAGELGMTDTNGLKTLGTRVDELESNIETVATELGMVQSGEIVNTNTRVDTLESTINDANTGLAATKAIADAAATASDLSNLAGRVTTLENNPQSTTVVIKNTNITYNNDGIPTNIGETPSTDKDYLLQGAAPDDKYYYWKYIQTGTNTYSWELISGAGGGTGTSSVEFYSALIDVPTPPSDTVDYFIGSGTNYIHYRYLNNTWVQILPSHLINSVTLDESPVSDAENAPTKSKPIIKEIGSNTNLLANFTAIQSIGYTQDENGTTLTWIDIDGGTDGVTITGGGGSASGATAAITRITNGNITTITGETCEIEFNFTATDSSGDTLATTSQGIWTVNRAQVATSSVVVGDNSFDITQYLRNGENNITLTVNATIDEQTVTRTKTWVVTVINFSLVWDYDESTINEGNTINFSCIPYGMDIAKTLYLKIGNSTQSQSVTTSGIPTTISVANNFNHGVYTAEMWMTATINGQLEETQPHLFHDFIVARAGEEAPIIAATLPSTTMDQYNTISIPFVVYTPTSNLSNVTLAVDGVTQDTREVGRTTQTWHYTPLTSGNKVLTITTGSVTKTLNLTVNSININNAEIGGYTFKLKASELPSNNALKAWHYDDQNPNTSKLQFSNNFNWVNGGIQTELDDNEQLRQYIRIKSGTTMTIPYKMFTTDPRINGMNFKIIFKIDNCRDYDATAATNIADDVGIQLNAHKAIFKSSDTEISTQYGEEEYTELEFEVYKRTLPDSSQAPNRYMIEWIDGVMTTAREYGEGSFIQTNEHAQNLVIGSNDCDICVYLVKLYPFALSRDDHITNFVADAPNAVEMIARYNRNDILDADEDIDYNKLAQKNRDCRVWLYDIDRMTTGKKDPVNVNKFQQIWENGDQYYQLIGENAKLTIQGTSSVNYRFGAANTDIDFRKSKAPNATLVDGYGNNLLSDELEYKGFKINDDSLPIEYSNMKVNFASCEQVNNMCNAEWYQRYQPFPSLSARDCMEFAMGVQFIKDRRQSEPADGSIVLFEERGAEFDPEKYYMYSIGNLGNSKKNTHIFHSEDECCIEIKENTSDAQKMKSFDSTWTSGNTDNYEMRFPDDPDADIAAGWERFVTWMVASNPNAATNAQLDNPVTFTPYTFRGHNRQITETEGRHFKQVLRDVTVYQYAGTYTHDTFDYRMAKMLSECEDYMAMDSVIYHFCFIERHTMVDNVAKNTFWSSLKEVGGPNDQEGYWIWDLSKNYDNDTADGNNNNGELRLDYGNEAADMYDGRPVFNGYDTVWFIFASHLYEACQAMFIDREAAGAWDSKAYHQYLTDEQQKIPERVWNECYWYDYLRTFENNIEKAWIAKLDGGQKIHQRKHFETYEEIYDSSKYRGGVSHNQSITLRGEAIDYQTLGLPAQESRFEITMFNKCYLTIWIGTNYQTVKCEKGVPVTVTFYQDNDPSKGYMSLANSVIDIDSGSMVQTIGDLSRIYPSSGQFGKAKRLRSLQIGSSTAGYYNPVFGTSEQLGLNNQMLEYLYVQNLPQAAYSLNLSNCPELKYLDASGSGFTGFVFANGGLLNEAYVNAPASLVMRNLDALTNANFHLTSPTAVTSLRLENCSLFDNYTFVNQLTNLNILRLTNINWSLDNNTLLDRLLGLMGIDEQGNARAQSYLAGSVELTGTVYGGDYNEYVNAWSPDLTIDVSHAQQFIAQHLVTYKDEDGTFLMSKYINHSSNIVDIVATQELSTPTKDPDIQYQYTFGSLQYSQYLPYSGWRLSTDSQSIRETYGANPSVPVNGDITVYAVYSTTPQQYIVRWLVGNKVITTTEPQNYGGGYNLSAPTIKDVQNANANTFSFTDNGNGTCSYRIMTGWEKLPTNIAPTSATGPYDINATWLERTNVNYNTILTSSEYSAEEKLLVLKNIQNARTNNLDIQDMFSITLGYDGTKPGTNLLNAPKRYTGIADSPITTYTPFAANTSFTLAIDYRFEHMTNDSANEAVLISCYDDSNSSVQGFKLFYNPRSTNTNPVPQISFGSTAQISDTNVYTIGSTINNRNIVVIRHRAGEPILYIYSGANTSGLIVNYAANEFRKTLTNESFAASSAKIILGGINSSSSSSINAHGTIYSVKYWEEDLGEGECVQLANWCHETTGFAVQDFTETDIHSALPIQNTNIVLHTLNASQMGVVTDAIIDNTDTTLGWDPSTIRTFYNNRIFHALPIKLQSIMAPTAIKHVKSLKTDGGYSIGQSDSTTLDYVFAPSYLETGIQVGDNENYMLEASGKFTWSGLNIMQYSNGQFVPYSSTDYINLRFPYRNIVINNNTKVFLDYPATSTSFEAYANSESLGLRTGDILIPSNHVAAYIYISGNDVMSGAPFVLNGANYLTTSTGAWIESTSWWTRSVSTGSLNGRNNSRFNSISNIGVAQPGSSNIRNNGIVYSIAL